MRYCFDEGEWVPIRKEGEQKMRYEEEENHMKPSPFNIKKLSVIVEHAFKRQ